MTYNFDNKLDYAKQQDLKDPLRKYRELFHMPMQKNGEPYIYLCGNSLGLQPKTTRSAIDQELRDWEDYGVEGHFHAKNPWMPYHEFLTEAMAEVVGAKSHEVVVMNTLSVNLHLMMVSFYQPTKEKYKILIESDAFPSDKYAVESQAKFHGYDPKDAIIELKPRQGEVCLRMEDIQSTIKEHGDQLALIMIGNTNYYTGQFFDMKSISAWGHAVGAKVGFDCAHGAGNVPLELHASGCDFAVWCSYKYLNSGPGSLGGVFVHERHAEDNELPKFTGWWGHRKDTRFKMRDGFEPIRGVESWQLSNPPILSMAAIWASLKIFKEAGINNLREKSVRLSEYMLYLIKQIDNDSISVITPHNTEERGSQLSIQVKNADKSLYEKIAAQGIIADWREPDVIRVAATAMYNSYEDVFRFVEILKKEL
jgi:kynureninase